MIVGGQVNGGQNELTEVVELTKTNSTPSFGQLPSARIGAVGAMIGNVPILCGGHDLDSCISFKNSQWRPSHEMIEKRKHAAGVQINSSTFWMLGGQYDFDTYTASTEFIIQGQPNGILGPELPYTRYG